MQFFLEENLNFTQPEVIKQVKKKKKSESFHEASKFDWSPTSHPILCESERWMSSDSKIVFEKQKFTAVCQSADTSLNASTLSV